MAIAASTTLSDEDVRCLIALAAYQATWYAGPPLSWLSERMGWDERQARKRLARMAFDGLVVSNGDAQVLARKEAVEVALAIWRASREQTSAGK